MNFIQRFKERRRQAKSKLKAHRKHVANIQWLKKHSKNYQLGRVKSACGGFSRIPTYGTGVENKGPTHFGCGPGFPKIKKVAK